jgi:SAM-dependent MidA family methyltransferase
MTTLRDYIDKNISTDGFISLHDYMDLALYHPTLGYYRRDQVIGADGDFITAPEISQMFGELTGLWLAHQCQSQHMESKSALVELGPGRGTLMADLLRAWQQTSLAVPPVHMIETSPALIHAQQDALSHISDTDIQWHQSVDALPDQPLLIIANEFFDALPVRQLRLSDSGWQEQVITSGADGWQLDWMAIASDAVPDHISDIYSDITTDADLSCITYAPALPAIMASLSRRIKAYGGAMLIIDYGKDDGFGDSIQAVYQHQPVDILEHTGAADLTAWVDFSHIKAVAMAHGLAATPLQSQGQFLTLIGIKERTEQLAEQANPELQRRLLSELDRLVNPAQMGQAFKVMALAPQHIVNPDHVNATPLPGWQAQPDTEQ